MPVHLTADPVDVAGWAVAGPVAATQRGAVWCPSPAAQVRVELALISAGIDLDRVTVATPAGLALSQSTHPVLSMNQRRHLMAGFLGSISRDLGPVLSTLARTPTGADEIAAALDIARLASAGRDEILVHATAHHHEPWIELSVIVDAYDVFLRQAGVTDAVGSLCDLALALRHGDAVEHWWTATPHLLVLGVDRLTGPSLRMLTSLLGPTRPENTSATIHGLAHAPTEGGRWLTRMNKIVGDDRPGTEPHDWKTDAALLQVNHPSMEAEAVAGKLISAQNIGTSWSDLYVVAPNRRTRLRSVARACRRAGIPIHGAPPPRLDGPIVDLIADPESALLDEPGISPSSFVWRQVTRLLPDLAQRDTEVVDLVVGLMRHAQNHDHLSIAQWMVALDQAPHAPMPPLPGPADAVTFATLDELPDLLDANPAAEVIVVGCIEGELPQRAHRSTFDAWVLDGPSEASDRTAADIAEQRWKLECAARGRSLTLLAAPEPGVLISRFAEGVTRELSTWPTRVIDTDRWDPTLTTTVNPVGLVPERRLSLSATQLTMFENCPWQYTVQYRLGLRTEGGVSARFGSYVHDVLERFLAPFALPRPARPISPASPTSPTTDAVADADHVDEPPPEHIEHTLEGLLDLAARHWSDDIIDHPSQGDDFRKRAVDQFTSWWEREGARLVKSNQVAYVEYPFNFEIGEHRMKGFIDRVDRTEHGGVAIIDYKTGAAKTLAQVSDDIQLATYHLAAVRDPALAALGPVESLTLNYLRDAKSIDQPIVDGHELVTSARIQSLIDDILNETHQPSTHANCDYCDLARLCDLQLEGRPVPLALGPTRS